MAKDVIVVVNIDAKPKASESLDILLISTEGQKDMAVYRDLDVIKKDFPGESGEGAAVYKMAAAMFNQGQTSLADTLIRKVKIAGIAPPEDAAAMVGAIEGLRELDDDFYMVLTDKYEDDYVKALAAWAESTEPTETELGAGIEDHRKIYVGQTNNKELVCTNRRSIIIYSDKPEERPDAAYVGNVGPFYPESVTWKFKRPQGLTVPDLTNGERDALEEAHINFLTTEYKREYVKNGTCADGEFIDVQLGADYIAYTMRNNLYDVFLTNAKVPYTDEGFALIAGAVVSALNQATRLGIIATDQSSNQGVYTVIIPKRSEASDEQARSRRMPDITWEALLEGAVHGVKVKGTLKATLSA
jgi:hypothetical protein